MWLIALAIAVPVNDGYFFLQTTSYSSAAVIDKKGGTREPQISHFLLLAAEQNAHK